MPPRERKRPKAVRAWADTAPAGTIDVYNIYPTKHLAESDDGNAQRVLIVPLSGKVLLDTERYNTNVNSGVLRDIEAALTQCDGKGKRIRVLILEEKP